MNLGLLVVLLVLVLVVVAVVAATWLVNSRRRVLRDQRAAREAEPPEATGT